MTPPRYTRRRAIALGAGAAAAGLFVACTGGPASSPGGSVTPARGFEVKARPRISKRPAPGTLRLGRLRNPGPGLPSDNEDLLLAYARLVAVDPRGPTVFEDLARAVEIPEPQTVRFTIRDSQRFHRDASGIEQPLSADSVRVDFQRHASEGVPLFSEVIDRMDRADSRTLVLHLKAPFGLLFELLAAPSASVRGEGMYAGTTERVGSGTWVPPGRATGTTKYMANPTMTGDQKPLLASIDVVGANVASELDAAFARGELDVRVHTAGVAPVSEHAAKGTTTQKRPARRMRGLGLSMLAQKNGVAVRNVPAFQDARVRRAVAMSLNREALLALDGSFTSGPVGPAHAGDAISEGDLNGHPIYRRDATEARKLLAAAGAENLAFRLLLPDLPLMLQLAQVVAEGLQGISLQPRLQNVPYDGWQKSFLAGDFETTLFDLGALDTPDAGLRLHTTEGIGGKFSLWGYSNPMYDVAVRAALSSVDPMERARKSREAQRLLLDDGPAMLPIGAPPEYVSVGPGITGYEFNAYDMNTGYLSTGWSAPQRA